MITNIYNPSNNQKPPTSLWGIWAWCSPNYILLLYMGIDIFTGPEENWDNGQVLGR